MQKEGQKMEQWAEKAYFQAVELAKTDAEYQKLLQQVKIAEEAYQKAAQLLPEAVVETVEKYLTLTEELSYRMTQLAYQVGCRQEK